MDNKASVEATLIVNRSKHPSFFLEMCGLNNGRLCNSFLTSSWRSGLDCPRLKWRPFFRFAPFFGLTFGLRIEIRNPRFVSGYY